MTVPDLSSIAMAGERLAGIAHRTPVLTSRQLDRKTGRQVFLKCENFQRGGAFKFRGAYNAISQLGRAERAAGVITHSSGNHAQGVALAASLLGVAATVVMPYDAPPVKRMATAGYGAQIVPCEAQDREEVTADLKQRHGYTLIHPFDNEAIIAGQGTAAAELLEEVAGLDVLYAPVGGGGLISGCALAVAAAGSACRVIGVEPAMAADANISWREHRIHSLSKVPATVADGLRPRQIGQRNLEIMIRYVHDMAQVSETEILESLYYILTRLKVVVEPSAAVALAPLLAGRAAPGRRVGVVLSGGNLDLSSWAMVAEAANASS